MPSRQPRLTRDREASGSEPDGQSAYDFMMDLAERLANRVQLTSDGLRLYEGAIEEAFGADVDYAQLIKIYGNPPRETAARYGPGECKGTIRRTMQGEPDLGHISTSHVERHNLTMRMSMRRFTKKPSSRSRGGSPGLQAGEEAACVWASM